MSLVRPLLLMIVSTALVAGCSQPDAMQKPHTVDINRAAVQAQSDIDTYLADPLQERAEASVRLGASTTAATPPVRSTSDTNGDVPATAQADYRCADGFDFNVLFDNRADTGVLSLAGKPVATLAAQRTASGIWYRGAGYDLRGKGPTARFVRPDEAAVTCTAD